MVDEVVLTMEKRKPRTRIGEGGGEPATAAAAAAVVGDPGSELRLRVYKGEIKERRRDRTWYLVPGIS